MSPATEPTTWGSPMQSTASPAAGPQPDNVLITIKFWADAKDVIVSLKILTNLSEIGASCLALTAYLYLPVEDNTSVSYTHLDVYKRQGQEGKSTKKKTVLLKR